MSARPSPKLQPGIWDALVVLSVVILAVAAAALVWRGSHDEGPLTAVVSVDGASATKIPLDGLEDTDYTVNASGYTLKLSVGEGEIWVEASNCPTQDCVHTGHISRSGQSIVCLPARVIITIEGPADDSGGPDIVIG